jgi:hypothetical protein
MLSSSVKSKAECKNWRGQHLGWNCLLSESGIVVPALITDLQEEAEELTAILTTCVKKPKQRKGER